MMYKILLIVDSPNWAFDNIAQYVKSNSENDIEILYTAMFADYQQLARYLSIKEFDVCHFFWRLYYAEFIKYLQTSGAHDELIEKRYSVSVPDYALLSTTYNRTNQLIGESASGMVFTNDSLRELYDNRFPRHGIAETIRDPLLIDIDENKVAEKINNEKDKKFKVTWIGNGAWNGAGKYADYKGANSVFGVIADELENQGVECLICDSSVERRSHSEVMKVLQESHVLCMTSLFEGTSLPVLEAMATGNAIVTTNTGIYPELGAECTDDSIVRRNSNDFLQAVLALNEDRDRWAHEANANLKCVSAEYGHGNEFLWDNYFHQIISAGTPNLLSHFTRPSAMINCNPDAPAESENIVCITTSRWHGVRNSSESLFRYTLQVPGDPTISDLDTYQGKNIVAAIEREFPNASIVISGGDDYHRRLLQENQTFFRSRPVSLLWHGSITQWQEEIHHQQFAFWNDQLTLGNINGISFFKEDAWEFFRRRGRSVALVKNWIPPKFNNNDIIRRKAVGRKLVDGAPIRIAVLAAANHPLKNPITQLMAAAMANSGNCDVIVPNVETFDTIQKSFRMSVIPIGSGLTQAEHSRALELADVALYATFTECSPMIPLEATQVGTPCIVSPAANIYQGYPSLEKALLVKRPDDLSELRSCIEKVIANYSAITKDLSDFYNEGSARIEAERREYYRWCADPKPMAETVTYDSPNVVALVR